MQNVPLPLRFLRSLAVHSLVLRKSHILVLQPLTSSAEPVVVKTPFSCLTLAHTMLCIRPSSGCSLIFFLGRTIESSLVWRILCEGTASVSSKAGVDCRTRLHGAVFPAHLSARGGK
jgi:hypothetical protein